MDSYKRFAAIYDELINNDINYEAWADKILDICNNLHIVKADYLDLACGTGNMTQLIAPYFKNTWGVDLSEEMLMEADSKLRTRKIKAKFILQDMREFQLNKKFDLITCCLDSINYITDIEDVKKCFLSVKNHLKEEGAFIFDLNSYYKLTNILGNNIFTYNSEDVVYIWENDCVDNTVEMHLTFFTKYGEVYERFEEEHIEKAYCEEEIQSALIECGLKIDRKLDNYCDLEINGSSERITYIVKKLK